MVLRVLLFPFAVLYRIVTGIRNQLYELNIKPTAYFDLPVIGVGNLAVGGTGKTPMIEHLVRLLGDDYKIATLSRGYGRGTKGFRMATMTDHAGTVGDEPFQIFKKFHDKITVAVGEERALAIPHILQHRPETRVILLDDAFQHRQVTPSFQVLLTDYNNLFYRDLLLPAGKLRESRRGAERANVIVVTKCPQEITDDAMMEIETRIRKYAERPVFFTYIRYGNPVLFHGTEALPDKVILVSGIANHKPLEQYVKQGFKVVKHFAFADHRHYTVSDVQAIAALAEKEQASILTTEKDAAKLSDPQLKKNLNNCPSYYLPIEVGFIKNGKDFDEMVLNAVKSAL